MLVYGGELKGVRVYLTEDAYAAQARIHAHEGLHGNACGCRHNDINTWQLEVMAGTLTFVTVERLASEPELCRYHTGSFTFAEMLTKFCGVKPAEVPVRVPFTSDEVEENETLLRKGWRPRLALVESLLEDSKRQMNPDAFVAHSRV